MFRFILALTREKVGPILTNDVDVMLSVKIWVVKMEFPLTIVRGEITCESLDLTMLVMPTGVLGKDI